MYNFNDHTRYLKLMHSEKNVSEARSELRVENLLQMVDYAENISVCRRKMLVEYFGEVCKQSASVFFASMLKSI